MLFDFLTSGLPGTNVQRHFAIWRGQELRGQQNVVLQQLEQDIMAGESNSERRPSDVHERGDDFHSMPPQQNGPSPFNDGPELIRDTHC